MRTHGIKLDDYRIKFPDAPVISETASNTVSKQLSKRNKDKWTDPNYREQMSKMRSEANKRNWKKNGYREARTKEAQERFTSKEFIDSVRDVRRETGRRVIKKRGEENPEKMRELASKALKDWWKDHYDEAVEQSKKFWESSEFREKISKAVSESNKERWKDPEFRTKLIAAVKAKWEDEAYKSMMVETARETCNERWKDPEFRDKMEAIWGSADYKEKVSKRILHLWATQTDRMLAATKKNGYGIKTKHTSSKTGETFTTRSKLEATFAQQLDEDDNVVYYAYESTRAPYLYENKEHTYIVDFYIVTVDGQEHHIELKPNKFSPNDQTQTKWKVAQVKLSNFHILNFPIELFEG